MPCQSCQPTDEAPGPSRPGLFAWTLLAAVTLLAALAAPCVLGYVYTHDDLGAFHLPLRAFYAEQLSRGEPFDWTPQLFCGFYLTGEGQAGTYHPLHLLLYRVLPLGAAWAGELLAGYALMLAGTYLFLGRLLGRRDAAMFGSLAFTFSGFNLLHFVHPNAIAVVAHIPWLLWTIDVMLVEPNRYRVAAAQVGIALLTGSEILLGYPQYVWFSLLAEAAYGLSVLAGSRYAAKKCTARADCAGDAGRAPRAIHPVTPWSRLAIAKLAGVMLGGVQLLPTLDWMGHSVRRSVDAAFTSAGSLHPLNLVQLVAPYLFTHRVVGQNTHELGVYVGAVPLMLIVWLVIRRREWGSLRRPVSAALGFGSLAILLALGKYGPIYGLQRLLPIVGSFRFPCRYIVLAALCAAVASAVALALLARQQERGEKTPWRRLRPVGMVVLLSLAAAIAGMLLGGRPFIAGTPALLAGPLLIGSAAVLLALSARGNRAALVGLVLFCAADLGYYGMSYAAYPHAERLDAYAAKTKTPPAAPDGRVLADVLHFGQSGLHTGNQMTLCGWHRADGYAALAPVRKLDYRRLPALRAAGVRWVRRTAATAAIGGLIDRDPRWLEVPNPLKRVRLVTRTLLSRDPARDVARIPLESVALVEEPLELPSGVSGTATTLGERPGRLHVRVDCPTKQLLVVSESYHPGWRAEVDGRPLSVLPANGDFLGCVVPPGAHEVVLEFRARSLSAGLIVSCLGLAMVAGIVAGHLLKAAPVKKAAERRALPDPVPTPREADPHPAPEEEPCPIA